MSLTHCTLQIHVPVVRGKGSLCQEMLTSLHKSGTHVPSDSSGRMYPEVVPRYLVDYVTG